MRLLFGKEFNTKSIVDVIKTKKEVIIGKGVSAEMVHKAEKELNVSFAEDYREYLLNYGLLMCCGHELTGLGKNERTHVVFVTKQMKELINGIPDNWYVLENANIDGVIIWQDTTGNVYFNTKKIYSSLLDFIISF